MQRQDMSRKHSKASNGAFSKNFDNAGDQIVKRMSVPNSILSSTAGGLISPTFYTSAEVESAPASEWASFAARYQQYRVRAIRVTGKALNPVQGSAVGHGILYRGDYIGSSSPTTPAQVLSDENVKVNATWQNFSHIVTWKRNPNAKLWNPTSAAIPTANVFAWVGAAATTPGLTASTTYYAIVVEYEVEFRGSQ